MKELEHITNLVKSIPDDKILGEAIRYFINDIDSNKNTFTQCIHCGIWQSRLNHKCKYCGEEI